MDEVQAMWSKVRYYLCCRSTFFGKEMRELTWPQRKAEILGKGDGTKVMVDIARDPSSGSSIGYCVSTVSSMGMGEVDSIFVDEGHRGQGIGSQLIERALVWMEGEGAEKIHLVVTYGNEEVLAFYERHGFYPRLIVLEKKTVN